MGRVFLSSTSRILGGRGTTYQIIEHIASSFNRSCSEEVVYVWERDTALHTNSHRFQIQIPRLSSGAFELAVFVLDEYLGSPLLPPIDVPAEVSRYLDHFGETFSWPGRSLNSPNAIALTGTLHELADALAHPASVKSLIYCRKPTSTNQNSPLARVKATLIAQRSGVHEYADEADLQQLLRRDLGNFFRMAEDLPIDQAFRGLDQFDEDDAQLFFGREDFTKHVLNITSQRTDGPRIMELHGRSGTGKSSFLKAGLAAQCRTFPWQLTPIMFTPDEFTSDLKGPQLASRFLQELTNRLGMQPANQADSGDSELSDGRLEEQTADLARQISESDLRPLLLFDNIQDWVMRRDGDTRTVYGALFQIIEQLCTLGPISCVICLTDSSAPRRKPTEEIKDGWVAKWRTAGLISNPLRSELQRLDPLRPEALFSVPLQRTGIEAHEETWVEFKRLIAGFVEGNSDQRSQLPFISAAMLESVRAMEARRMEEVDKLIAPHPKKPQRSIANQHGTDVLPRKLEPRDLISPAEVLEKLAEGVFTQFLSTRLELGIAAGPAADVLSTMLGFLVTINPSTDLSERDQHGQSLLDRVTLEPIKRSKLMRVLGPHGRALLQAFEAARLVRRDRFDNVTLTHALLLTSWERAQAWLDQRADKIEKYARLRIYRKTAGASDPVPAHLQRDMRKLYEDFGVSGPWRGVAGKPQGGDLDWVRGCLFPENIRDATEPKLRQAFLSALRARDDVVARRLAEACQTSEAGKQLLDLQLPDGLFEHSSSPVLYTAESGMWDTCSYILKHARQPFRADRFGINVLHVAARESRPDILRVAEERLRALKANPAGFKSVTANDPENWLKTDSGWSLVHFAAQKGSLETVRATLDILRTLGLRTLPIVPAEARSAPGSNVFHLAAARSDFDAGTVLGALFEFVPRKLVNPIIAQKDSRGLRPLHQAIFSSNPETLQIVLDLGPPGWALEEVVWRTGGRPDTALVIAVHRSNHRAVGLLVNRLRERTDGLARIGEALRIAAGYGRLEAVEEVLAGVSDETLRSLLTCTDEKGRSAIHLAAQFHHTGILALMLSRSPCLEALDRADTAGCTPLASAMSYDDTERADDVIGTITVLLDHGANPIAGGHGKDAVSEALRSGRTSALLEFSHRKIDIPVTVDSVVGIVHLKHGGLRQELLRSSGVLSLEANDPRLRVLLGQAVFRGLDDLVNSILEQHPALLNADLGDGTTPILKATQWNSAATMTFLRQRGADYEARNLDERNALHLIAFSGHSDVLDAFCENTDAAALIRLGNAPDKFGKTPLYYAANFAHPSIVKKLIDLGCDPRIRLMGKDSVDQGNLPIHAAAYSGNLASLKLLLEQHTGEDLSTLDKGCKHSLLSQAIFRQHIEVVKFLIDAYPDYVASVACSPRRREWSPIAVAISKLTIDEGSEDGRTNKAIDKKALEVFEVLVDFLRSRSQEFVDPGAHANAQKSEIPGIADALLAAGIIFPNPADAPEKEKVEQTQEERLRSALDRDNAAIVAAIAGNDWGLLWTVQEHDPGLRTYIERAVARRSIRVLRNIPREILEDRKDSRFQDGVTLLHLASRLGNLEFAERLTELGASTAATDDFGATPLFEAAYFAHPNVVRHLLHVHPEGHRIPNSFGKTPLHAVVNLARQKAPESTESRAEIVELLLSSGAELTSRDSKNRTPAELADANGWKELFAAESIVEPRQKVITHGALSPARFLRKAAWAISLLIYTFIAATILYLLAISRVQ